MNKKIGRPTNNPKIERITVRLDEESLGILDKYCIQEKIDRGEATRRGIKKLKDDLNKK
ncbi:ribbon-helix-helix protein, CopG family [Fusobacterium ulcerans]|uniref:ribbon-helix-helix protein, CopG family n=1 Tax=Fusobacterium ulcerans TaxID=861 RepID=UPI002E775EA8|nr:ribbon-helix-helix protein, CopG family [Fusobacterium ulcerans]MEE0139712.1 ribbon-helix-helix protein, CopG family [Fusobacterium ulcerans]